MPSDDNIDEGENDDVVDPLMVDDDKGRHVTASLGSGSQSLRGQLSDRLRLGKSEKSEKAMRDFGRGNGSSPESHKSSPRSHDSHYQGRKKPTWGSEKPVKK